MRALSSPRQCYGSGQGFPKCHSLLRRWYIPPMPIADGQKLALPASWDLVVVCIS